MTQIDLTEVAAAYLDRTLPALDRVRFLLRLVTCRDLRRYLDALRDIARITGYTPRVFPPPETGERIVRCFGHWNPASRRARAAA